MCSDVEEAHLRVAGVGGIIAFFGAFFSSSMEEQKHTMIHGRKKISDDYRQAAGEGKHSHSELTDKMEGLTWQWNGCGFFSPFFFLLHCLNADFS